MIQRVLLFRQDALGDVLFSTPLLRRIRERCPDAETTFVLQPQWNPVLQSNDAVDHLLPGKYRPKFAELGLWIRRVRAIRPDAALLLRKNSSTYALACRLAGVPLVIGYTTNWYGALFHHNVLYPEPCPLHDCQRILRMGNYMFEEPLEDGPLEFPVTKLEADAARAALDQLGLEQPYCVVHVSTGGSNRPWTREGFAKAADALAGMGLLPVFSGSAAEAQNVRSCVALCDAPALDLSGKTSLVELRELVAGAALVLSNDTGVVHVASACRRPVVGIYPALANPPHRFGPWMTPHRTIEPLGYCPSCTPSNCTRSESVCVDSISPDRVIEAARELLAETGP